tara:strand:+ start:797 stop:1402 length:606 start_codon:yes stop_codon:yes gene_type:complete
MTQTINTATPDYIVDSTLTDGEAWVPLITTVVSGTSTTNIQMQSSTGANDWSQYMDLVLIGSARSLTTDGTVNLRFNNDTGSNYVGQILQGNGTDDTAYFQSLTNADIATVPRSSDTADYFGSFQYEIFDINSGKYTSLLGQRANNMNAAGSPNLTAITTFCWKNQAAVTEIDVFIASGTGAFAANSRFDLFGVLPRMVTV